MRPSATIPLFLELVIPDVAGQTTRPAPARHDSSPRVRRTRAPGTRSAEIPRSGRVVRFAARFGSVRPELGPSPLLGAGVAFVDLNRPIDTTDRRDPPPGAGRYAARVGGVAQWIEQEPSKLKVAGSIPAAPVVRYACKSTTSARWAEPAENPMVLTTLDRLLSSIGLHSMVSRCAPDDPSRFRVVRSRVSYCCRWVRRRWACRMLLAERSHALAR